MRKNAATSRHASGPPERQPQRPHIDSLVRQLAAGEPEPDGREHRRDGAEDEQRRPPTSRCARERYRHRGGERRADRDPGGVDGGGEARPVGEPLLDRDGQHRAGEAHPDADREREDDHGDGAGRDRARDAEEADQRERARRSPAAADPARQERGGRCEQAHAEHRNRPEQAGDGVRDVEVVLDRRQQRADADELRPQRERRQKQRDQERRPPQAPLERLVERALARLHQREELADRESLEVLRRAVRLEGLLVAVGLVEQERPRILGIATRDVRLAAGLCAGRLGQFAGDLDRTILRAFLAFMRTTRTNDIRASFVS